VKFTRDNIVASFVPPTLAVIVTLPLHSLPAILSGHDSLFDWCNIYQIFL